MTLVVPDHNIFCIDLFLLIRTSARKSIYVKIHEGSKIVITSFASVRGEGLPSTSAREAPGCVGKPPRAGACTNTPGYSMWIDKCVCISSVIFAL